MASSKFESSWTEQIQVFLSLKQKILDQEVPLDAWMQHVNILRHDYNKIFELSGVPTMHQHLSHYTKEYFAVLLLTMDKVVFLQTGRIVKLFQNPSDRATVCVDRFNSFTWEATGKKVKLSCLCVDGYQYRQKQLVREFDSQFASLKVSGV